MLVFCYCFRVKMAGRGKGISRTGIFASLMIAELTGKRHDNVLTDCDNLNKHYDNMGLLKIQETPYKHPQNGKVPLYYLTPNYTQIPY